MKLNLPIEVSAYLSIYIAFAGSGFIGAVVFFTRLIAGNGDLETNLGNLALQIGVLALMLWLYRIDRSKK